MLMSEIFTDESKWTKGSAAKDKDGNIVSCLEPEATCFCFYGAFLLVNGGTCQIEDWKMLAGAARVSPAYGIAKWNDNDATFADILDAARRLDAMIERKKSGGSWT